MFFQTVETYNFFLKKWGKNEKKLKLEKKEFRFWKKNPIPIPKLDLGFDSRYQNLVSVAQQAFFD